MKIPLVLFSWVAILVLWLPPVRADVSAGLKISDGEIRDFHLAIGTHYHVPAERVAVYRKRKIPDEHLPVVIVRLFIFVHDHS